MPAGGVRTQASPTTETPESARAGALGEAALRQEEARPASYRQAFSQAAVQGGTVFMASFREGLSGSRIPQVRNINTGRVTDESADELRARKILGTEEFSRTADRSVRADGEGTWVNEGGNIRNMQYGQSSRALREVRSAMNDDAAFNRLMENDIKLSDAVDSRTGVPYVIENQSEGDSGYRSATQQEAAAIRMAGRDAFEEAGDALQEDGYARDGA